MKPSDILRKIGLYPNLIFSQNPFKLMEYDILVGLSNISKTDVCLDFGCGNGEQTIMLGKKCKKITGVDISSEAIRLAKIEASHHNNLSVDFISNDITKIKLPDNTFDKIFSFCVIEHISNYNEILKELHRILKKDGTLIMSVDSLSGIDPELKRKHKKEHSVHNYFTLNTFNNTMLNSGFSSIEKRYIFCGKYAKRLFEKGIQNKFRFNILATLYYYVNLSIRERFSNKKEGMFIAGVYKKT